TSMAVGSKAKIKVTTPKKPSEIENTTLSFESENPGVATVDAATGEVSAIKSGVANIVITATLGNVTKKINLGIACGTLKSRRSFYSDETVANARENIEKYAWAQSECKAAVQEADKYVGREELLWNSVTTQNLPRSYWTGLRLDPEYRQCYSCHTDIYSKYGSNPWIIDPINDPWKIQCPECKRKFPSNDFESFYTAGLDEKGNWSYEKSKANGSQYLVNTMYPDEGPDWCVDDGFGYVTGKKFSNGVVENKCFIAFYNEVGLWYATYRYNTSGLLIRAIDSLSLAYLYTGDARYGRTGAILLDRIADVYPDMDLTPFSKYFNSDGGTLRGKVLGKISDYNMGLNISKDYDALWPAMADPYVVDFLSKKAATLDTTNPKTSPETIRMNCDDGLMREINKAVRDCRINGNFGQHLMVLATAAVTLDT
ncbi:MAG: Ig-like domain-containing protein, partial [Oscillospiraceae bacterium]